MMNVKLIFHWLYDEVCYREPSEKSHLFFEHQVNLGWKLYYHQKSIPRQPNFFYCGIYALSFVECALLDVSPSGVTHDIVSFGPGERLRNTMIIAEIF